MTNANYNGYVNYETWNVALWLSNEGGSYRHWTSEAEDAYREAEATSYSTRLEVARRELGDRIKEDIEEANPLGSDASMFSDLLGAALSEVDWSEVAEDFLTDEMAKEIEDEEAEDEDTDTDEDEDDAPDTDAPDA